MILKAALKFICGIFYSGVGVMMIMMGIDFMKNAFK